MLRINSIFIKIKDIYRISFYMLKINLFKINFYKNMTIFVNQIYTVKKICYNNYNILNKMYKQIITKEVILCDSYI